MNPDGVLWYRGFVLEDEDETEELLKIVLATHGVKRIVVGHTVSKGGIRFRAKGQVIMIDVGMSGYYGGPASCLLIEKARYYAVYPESKQELAIGKGTMERTAVF